MDFINRSQQPRANVPNGPHQAASNSGNPVQATGKHGGGQKQSKWFRISAITLLFSVVILLVALAAFFGFWGNNTDQQKLVDKNQYQAVFINVDGTTGGQVYFGHIQEINSQFIELTNVFYIQDSSSSSSSSSNQYTLVKLGCELHAPEDQMIINTSQVFFWENLRPSGQVTQKINQYYQENPNGLNCSSDSSTTQDATNPSTTGTTNTTSTDNTSTDDTTK